MKTHPVLLWLALTLPVHDAIACLGAPPIMSESADALIDCSPQIVLARAISAEQGSEILDYDGTTVRYKFVVLDTLAGSVSGLIEIVGTPPLFPFELSDYSGHTDPEFWKDGGRAMFYPDCEFHPSFAIGRTYLMFLKKPYNSKSFELIRVPPVDPERDKWLQYVRARLEAKRGQQ